jgi:hypothetical protein
MTSRRADEGLGLFSIALGVTQLVAPRWLGVQAGLGQQPRLLRLIGVRELLTGAGVLLQRTPNSALWLRVLGDLVDFAVLMRALRQSPRRTRAGIALTIVSIVGLIDLWAAYRAQRQAAEQGESPLRVRDVG